MCDAAMMGNIEEVVEKFVDEQRMFTAYDVTCEIRGNVGRGVNVKHSDIKNDIHKEMAQHLDNDWQKTLQDVGAAVSAFVYYHFMSDPTNYEPQSSGSAPATPAADGNHQHSSPAATATAPAATATVASSDAFAVDGRSRLLIPTTFMQHLGVKGGDEVKVYKELDFIVVSKEDQQLRELACIKVDNHGYVYLSAKILGQGDLGDAQTFDVDATDVGIEVKKA
jgi:hypothetical protein